MNRYELLKILSPSLEMAKKHGISDCDVGRDRIFTEYLHRKAEGEKVEAIATDICEREGMSRASFFLLIKRMKEPVRVDV